MGNNIAIGPQAAKGIIPTSFADANIVAANTNEVILVDEEGYHFFNPNNGSIPQINSFEFEKSYIFNSKVERDLSRHLDTVLSAPSGSVSTWVDNDNKAFADTDGKVFEI